MDKEKLRIITPAEMRVGVVYSIPTSISYKLIRKNKQGKVESFQAGDNPEPYKTPRCGVRVIS